MNLIVIQEPKKVNERVIINTQLPHKMPSDGLGNFAMMMNISRKVTTITILQNKVNSILSLQKPKPPKKPTLTHNYKHHEKKAKKKKKNHL